MSVRAGAALAILLLALPAVALAQEIDARLDRRQIAVGENTTLRVTVRGATNVKAPEFEVPQGLTLLASSRQQSFAWVNGRASVETEFRYEIAAEAVGSYAIGPILVSVGAQAYRGGTIGLEVVAVSPPSAGGTGSPAALRVDVRPRDPYVGQEVSLSVRLVQRSSFAEDPQYTPPTTTGFWTDRPTTPESFYADERGERVLVTETRTRLYPLAVGDAVIGDAAAIVTLAEDSPDPFGLFGGNRRELVLRSAPIPVHVRPLPAGAPAGFGGAVGQFTVAWSSDRRRTSRDVPVTLRLDVRGRGNLPLVRAPEFMDPDADVLASTVDDSLSAPEGGIGRKRFQWTVMPKREGALRLGPPIFAWFDPVAGQYRATAPGPLEVEVGPAVFSASGPEAGFPRALGDRPVDPAARPASPWAFALAGVALGVGWRQVRSGAGPRGGDEAASKWSARVRGVTGVDFWKAAEDACEWLEAHPGLTADTLWQEVRARVAAARYGGSTSNPEAVRREVLARLARIAPGDRGRLFRRSTGLLLLLAAVSLVVVFGPHPGGGRAAEQSAAADQAARRGELEKARRVWLELWRAYGGQAGLAARLAWAHVQAGEIGPAALWVMRGESEDPRDPGVGWVEERVREAGGLVGAGAGRLPVRKIEWAIAALLLGLSAVLLGSRPGRRIALVAAWVVVAAADPAQAWLAARSGRAIVVAATGLEGTDVELEPGQMVMVRDRRGDRVHVVAGRVIDGWVPAASVARVSPPRGQDG